MPYLLAPAFTDIRVLRFLMCHNSGDVSSAAVRKTMVVLLLCKTLSLLKTKAHVKKWALLIYSLSRDLNIVVDVF